MPIVAAAVPAAIGLYQAIAGGVNKRKAQKAAQAIHDPVYAPSKAIQDYYQEAMNRYNAGPYNSLQYQQAQKTANTGLAAGINALQSRKAGGNVGALVGQYNNNLLNAGVAAQRQQQSELGQVGQAANALTADQRYAYQQNQVAPAQRALQWEYAKMGGASQLENAGLSNIGAGLQTGIMAYMNGRSGMGGQGLGYSAITQGLQRQSGVNSPANMYTQLDPNSGYQYGTLAGQ